MRLNLKIKNRNFLFGQIAFFAALAAFAFVFAHSAWAAEPVVYGDPPKETVTGGIGSYIARLYQIGFGVVGVAAFFSIVFGGLQYTVSAGNPSKISDAKDRIEGAIYGILLLLMSWIILNTINPRIVALGQPGGFDPTSATQYPAETCATNPSLCSRGGGGSSW